MIFVAPVITNAASESNPSHRLITDSTDHFRVAASTISHLSNVLTVVTHVDIDVLPNTFQIFVPTSKTVQMVHAVDKLAIFDVKAAVVQMIGVKTLNVLVGNRVVE